MKAPVSRRKQSNQTGGKKSKSRSVSMYRSQKEGSVVLRGRDVMVSRSCPPLVLQLVASEAARLSQFSRMKIITALVLQAAMGRVLLTARLRPSAA